MNCTNHPEVTGGIVNCARCGGAFCQDCVVEIDGKPYDAACKEEQIRDLRSGTAETDYATAGRRFAAEIIDVMICTLISMPLILLAGGSYLHAPPIGTMPWVLQLLIGAVIYIIYEGLMLSRGGQTLGKKAVGIRVINADGSEIQTGSAFSRAVSRYLMSATYVLGIVDSLMVFSTNRRTLHDRFAKTVVVNTRG